jgi:hypothetical protein
MYELDRAVRKTIRKAIQQPVRDVRGQLERQIAKQEIEEAEGDSTVAQLQVLNDYALAVQSGLNLEGQQPFRYASLAVDEALSEIGVSLARLEKGG